MYERRRQIAGRYEDAFKDHGELQRPRETPGTQHAWHIYAIRLHLDALRIDRDAFIEELRKRNIGTSVHFIPIHLLSYYRDKYHLTPEDFPVATREFERLLSLPIYSQMTDADVDDVIEAVGQTIATHRR
jgi:dTDP-4-amino-4,6-dideoxygalactose transaminase